MYDFHDETRVIGRALLSEANGESEHTRLFKHHRSMQDHHLDVHAAHAQAAIMMPIHSSPTAQFDHNEAADLHMRLAKLHGAAATKHELHRIAGEQHARTADMSVTDRIVNS